MRARLFLASILFSLALLSPLPAQSTRFPFVEDGRAQIPPGPVPWILLPGDVDGDGDLDLASFTDVSVGGNLCHLLRNDGKGHFFWDLGAFSGGNHLGNCPHRVFRGDLNGDGSLDLVLGNPLVFVNGGKGFFRADPKALPPLPSGTGIAGMADVDGDGDLDLLAVQEAPLLKSFLLVNDGKGRFTKASSLVPPPPGKGQIYADISLFLDADKDGDMDYVGVDRASGSQGWVLRISWNDGKGNFKTTSRISMGGGQNGARCLIAGDVDGDGFMDLFLAPASRLFLNNGKGQFQDVSGTHLAAPVPGDLASFRDFDRDGDLDLAAGSGKGIYYVENKGKGRFLAPVLLDTPSGGKFAASLATGDFDSDGDCDIVYAGSGRPLLLLNDGKARFHAASGAPFRKFDLYPGYFASSQDTRDAMGDVDGDGDPDFIGDGPGKRFLLLLNDGSGNFDRAPLGNMPVKPNPSPVFTYRLHLLDVDGDGDLDLLGLSAVNRGSDKNVLYLNDGKGVFRDVSSSHFLNGPFKIQNTCLAAGDFDKDGDVDLILGDAVGEDVYLLNDGKGRFRRTVSPYFPFVLKNTRGLAAADVDGDGDLDLVRIGPGGAGKYWAQVFRNDGKGRFKGNAPFFTGRGIAYDHRPLVADLDGDGDPDLVLGLFFPQGSKPPSGLVFFNDGKGNFTMKPAGSSVAGFPGECLDLDGDGDKDLVLSGTSPVLPGYFTPLAAWNDGKGTFSPPTSLAPAIFTNSFSMSFKVLGGDFDGDGLPDLLVSSLYPLLSHHVLFNSLRHLRAPWLCSLGKPYRLEIFGSPGQGAFLFMGLKAGNTALPPFGALKVDPSRIWALSPMPILWGPKAWWQGRVPRDAALLGRELFFQALVLDPLVPARSRFTGLVRDQVGAW